MSASSINPLRISGYGILGQETAIKMNETLKTHSLSTTYNESTKKFTVLGSSKVSKKAIEEIFSECKFLGWQPQVLDETDQLGNRLMQLRPIDIDTDSLSIHAPKVAKESYSRLLELKTEHLSGFFKVGAFESFTPATKDFLIRLVPLNSGNN